MFAIQHPIRRLIDSQYEFFKSMVDRFPQLLNEWVETQLLEVEKQAKDYAQGDYDVFITTYNSEIARIEPCDDEELLFNQAMLIMVYSFYESMLNRIVKEMSNGEIKSTPSAIARKSGVVLEAFYRDISSYLYHVIRPIRNQLCHNNSGTIFARDDKEADLDRIEELKKQGHIRIEDDIIYIMDRLFIHDVLDKEYKLLIKLADICGFKVFRV